MRRLSVLASAGMCCAAAGTAARASGAYTYTDLARGTDALSPSAINATDQIAGRFTDAANVTHGFVDTNGAFQTFDGPESDVFTGTYAINKTGRVTFTYGTPNSFTRAVTYGSRTGVEVKIFVHGASQVYPYGVNDSGAVVGYAKLPDRSGPHGFLRSGRVVAIIDPPGSIWTSPRAIANDGTVVGSYYSSTSVSHGFTYRNGVYATIDAPGGVTTYATGINQAGTIAGYDKDSAGNLYGWTKNHARFTQYSFPGGAGTTVIRALGGAQVIGAWYDTGSNLHAYHFVGGSYYNLAPASAVRMTVAGVNARGDFTGTYYDQNSVGHPFLATCRPTGAACQQ